MLNIRFKIISWLLRCYDFILIADVPCEDDVHAGVVMETVTKDPEGKKYMTGVLASCMENRPVVADTILDAALAHLRRYEVQSRNFTQKLYEK